MIFSHGGELWRTCDVCGRKFVFKHYNPVLAGHLTVCFDIDCIIDAMHSTWVPRLAVDEEILINRLSKKFNLTEKEVDFHFNLAKAVYETMENPKIHSLGGVMLLEAIIAEQFPCTDSHYAIDYAQAIDVLLKPYWVPYWRKDIDTNYPFASVVNGSAHGMNVPWVLHDLRRKHSTSSNMYEAYLRNFRYNKFDAKEIAHMRIFWTQSCANITMTRSTILLWQIYMFKLQERSIFGNPKDFAKFCRELENCPYLSETDWKKLWEKVFKIVDNDKLNFYEMLMSVENHIKSLTAKEIKLNSEDLNNDK